MANNSFSKKCDYISKAVRELSVKELEDLKSNLVDGNELCPICHEWTNHIMKIPQKYKDNDLYMKWGGQLGFLCMPSSIQTYSIFRDIPILGVTRCCVYCISFMANIYRKNRDKDYNINHGIVEYNELLPLRKDLSGRVGFVYIAKFKEGYKIGATVSSIVNRLVAYGCSRDRFVCAIGINSPFSLERFFHELYKKKNVILKGLREIFNLSEDDLKWIRGIKSVNGEQVTVYHDLDKAENYLDSQ